MRAAWPARNAFCVFILDRVLMGVSRGVERGAKPGGRDSIPVRGDGRGGHWDLGNT